MPADASIATVLILFALATITVLITGTRMTALADRIADRTGIGEAVAGGVLLGVSTSLAGTVVSVTSALDGRASLAFANGVGGIAAQTAFLAAADMIYRRANLEHASAEPANLYQGTLLLLMLTLPFLATTSPELTMLGMHPVSFALLAIYGFGVRTAARVRRRPMWIPVRTLDTRDDRPEARQPGSGSTARLLAHFAALAAALAVAGYVIAWCGGRITDALGISATAVGALMTAVATSLPELVTTLAAVRRGALQLAVGGIIGGNTFDVLFLTLSDAGYRAGSLYHAVGIEDLYWLAVGACMTAILVVGLVVRERRGVARIGFESMAILLVYLGSVIVQAARA